MKEKLSRRRVITGIGAPLLLSASGCTSPATSASTMPRSYSDKSEMMAIGDSLFQGVRSLSYTSQTSSYSPPALVAEALGVQRFTVATPPRPILWDLESTLRLPLPPIVSLGSVPIEAKINAIKWRDSNTWADDEAFDNVSVGGAQIDSLYLDDYDTSWKEFSDLLSKPLPIKTLSDMWYALNVCFTLNPRREESLRDRTQMRQVADRKPKTLMVNIGSNEGLFSAAFLGDIASANQTLPASLTKMRVLATELSKLPVDVEYIIFNSLVRPRTGSNLMPADRPVHIYPGEDYFDAYGPWLFSSQQPITGKTMEDFDELVKQQNYEVRDIMKEKVGSRLVFVDLYEMSTRYDAKHFQGRTLNIGDHHLENVPLNGETWSYGGGLTGLDNLHPTIPGYSLIADGMLEAMGRTERVDKLTALHRDTLLNKIPPLLDEAHEDVLKVARVIQEIGATGMGSRPSSAPAANVRS
jgi:hypothetical protein